MDIEIQNVRPEFKELLRCNGLTLGNWNKFKKQFNQQTLEDKAFYEKVLNRITDIRKKYRDKNIVINEIEELFIENIKNIKITGSEKNKN